MKVLRLPFGRQQRNANKTATTNHAGPTSNNRNSSVHTRASGSTSPKSTPSPPSRPPLLLSKILQSQKNQRPPLCDDLDDARSCSPTNDEVMSCTASHDDNDDVLTTTVRFDLSATVYREDALRDMSNDEQWADQWYAVPEIDTFRQAQITTASNLLDNSFRLSPQAAKQAEAWKTLLQKEYKACAAAAVLEDDTTTMTSDDTSTNSSRSMHEDALIQLYRHPSSSCSNQDDNKEEDESYCWVGLETNLLARFRGKARRQSRFILEQVDKLQQQQARSSSSTTESTVRNSHYSSSDDDAAIRASIASIQSVTVPSLRFAQHVAQVQAKALQQDDKEEQQQLQER